MFEKNNEFLTAEQLNSIQSTRVLIVGAGALGQMAAHTLLRSGFVRLTVADGDCFVSDNDNRQLYARPEKSAGAANGTEKDQSGS